MSKAPAMPMYWDAYLADTTHLTTEEHGAYMLLLAAMWRRNGSVPDDDRDNARILGLTPAKWRRVKGRLLETVSGFRVKNGLITQEKLQKTWEKTQEKIAKNRANGGKGGRPKTSKNNEIGKANGSISVNPNESIPEPEPEPEPDKVGAKAPSRAARLEGFQTFWDLFPHRGGAKKDRKKAEAAWLRCVQGGAEPQKIIDAAERYRGDGQVLRGYGKGPVPWLNGDCFNDEIEPQEDRHDNRNSTATNRTPGGSGPHSTLFAGFGAVAADDDGGSSDPSPPMRDITPAGDAGLADGADSNPPESFLRVAYVRE